MYIQIKCIVVCKIAGSFSEPDHILLRIRSAFVLTLTLP